MPVHHSTNPQPHPSTHGYTNTHTHAGQARGSQVARSGLLDTSGGPNTLDRLSKRGWTRRAGRRDRSERGAVIAEMAIALPVLVALLLLGIWTIGLVVLNIQCIDAARDVARAVARGEPPDRAEAIGRRAIPTGTVTITRDASDIQVTVTATPTHKPPLLTFLTPTRLTATATLQAEPETS